MIASVSELQGINEKALAAQKAAIDSDDSAAYRRAYEDGLIRQVNPDLIPGAEYEGKKKEVTAATNGAVIGERAQVEETDEQRATILNDANDTHTVLSKLNVDQRVDLMTAFNKAVMGDDKLDPVLSNMITVAVGKSKAAADGELGKASQWFDFLAQDEAKNVVKNFSEFGTQTGFHVRNGKGKAVTDRSQLTEVVLATRYPSTVVNNDDVPAEGEVKGNGITFSQPPKNYPFALGIGDVLLAMFAGNATVMKVPADMQDIFQTFGAYWNDFVAEYAEDKREELGLSEADVAVLARRKTLQTVTSYGWEAAANNARVVSALDTGNTVHGNYTEAHGENVDGQRFSGELAGANVLYVGPDLDEKELRLCAKQWCARVIDNMGMICTKIEDGMVHEAIADRFYEIVAEEFEKFDASTIGNPHAEKSEGVVHGKHTDPEALQKAAEYLDEARELGATVVGGELSGDGRSMTPAVVLWPKGQHDQHLETRAKNIENFAPITNLMTVSGVEESVEITNKSQCNLTASLWTKDPEAIAHFYNYTELGSYNIFNPKHGSDNAPYGEHIGFYHRVEYVDERSGETRVLHIPQNAPTGGLSHIEHHLAVNPQYARDAAWIAGDISEEFTVRTLVGMGADLARDTDLGEENIVQIAADYGMDVENIAPSLAA